MTRTVYLIAVVLCAIVAAGGCRKQADPAKIADAESCYAAAKELFEKGDYQGAADTYAAAVSAGGLFADLYAIAQVRRAESLARIHRLEEALQILAAEEAGSPNLAEIHQIRAFILTKQRRPAEAEREFRKARGYDPAVEKLKE